MVRTRRAISCFKSPTESSSTRALALPVEEVDAELKRFPPPPLDVVVVVVVMIVVVITPPDTWAQQRGGG